MFDLTGKHVCYVADCGGIALETSKVLMTKNIAKLAILQSTENPQAIAQLQSIKPSTQIFFWTYDVTMAREDMKKYFDEVMVQMDYIDVLINGATLCDENNIDATINTNLTGMMNTVATVLPYMDRKMGGTGGLIVNVTSVIGLDPSPVFCAYSASKFGVIGFTRSLADPLYYSQNGVAVMAVCCGPTRVFVDRELKAFLEYGQSFADRLRRAPCQSTSVCGQNIVNAIERSENGQIWIADKGGLELVKLHWYWHMADQFVHYMQSNDEEDQD
uniref:Alcohol dehydrogenase-related 31 kDa protein n=2 Tax=Drosophila melanogaster TaxID=7227 RepID=ADHR_DROME|nr:Adh-related, isoform B [Drosophila melanogaster]NP_001285938.1 Adh-related, isoform C [Drosophila melanogaster]NP_477495.1 Adh-related, isoform A [Drosophila melanogaster]P91615.1 RecName: Full=Alcohol dehydrogenase-related 31 kDa protein [Drosophila melanogaster]AAF53404.1 Adh-related, isoform A [Drosophila melanogaster]AAO41202.1 Adh-related, isoform B [Drosophila melanogaster]AHN54452.1 Adh-related, isoform C [Drosophila melanogaster]WDI23429.1 Adh-related transcript variant C [Drosoph|eukprot:NP_001027272.1 Adh-related, isoform B [Drosophila melanogaster]